MGVRPKIPDAPGEPLRSHRTTGLTPVQLDELTRRVETELAEAWDKEIGRPKACGLRQAVAISCMYVRQNGTQEFLGDLQEVSQSTVSRIIVKIVPIVRRVLEEFVPTVESASEVLTGRACLVDGTITPCWSYRDHQALWSRKKGVTGFNTQVVTLLDGTPVFVSDPIPGHNNDVNAFTRTKVSELVAKSGGAIADGGYQGHIEATPRRKPKNGELSSNDKKCNTEISKLRAPVERAIAHLKSWRILHTDHRRPYAKYQETFAAARALFFFSLSWGFE